MGKYGFRVMELIATPPYKGDRIDFTEPDPKGLYGAVLAAAKSSQESGEVDEQREMYTRITSVKHDAWGILLTVKGGSYGEERELLDVDSDDPDEETRPVSSTDAVLSNLRVLFLIPPYGTSGLLVAETRARSHWTTFVSKRLNDVLKVEGVKLRVDRQVVDALAWSNYLSGEGIGVKSVELTQTTQSSDRTRFTSENVRSVRLQLNIADGSELKERLASVLRGFAGGHAGRPRLAGIVGLQQNFTEDDFDEEKIVIVDGERQRKISVSGGWPQFTYPIDADAALSDAEFLRVVLGVARDIMDHVNIDIAANWRPRIS